jgi:hypothetical protein
MWHRHAAQGDDGLLADRRDAIALELAGIMTVSNAAASRGLPTRRWRAGERRIHRTGDGHTLRLKSPASRSCTS